MCTVLFSLVREIGNRWYPSWCRDDEGICDCYDAGPYPKSGAGKDSGGAIWIYRHLGIMAIGLGVGY